MKDLVIPTPQGLYCPKGNFHIDAQESVPLTLLTHAHGDHARRGSRRYLSSRNSKGILQYRLGNDAIIEAIPYGEKIKIGDVWVSLHPAGHILGSAQIRIEAGSEVWVVSGDYKRAVDPSCEPFEVVECNTFITESTFALPIYKWPDPRRVVEEIYQWWQENAQQNVASILYCYALGKSQRILSLLAAFTDRPLYGHGAILPLVKCYLEQGIKLNPIKAISEAGNQHQFSQDLILAPLSAAGTPWLKRFYPYHTGCVSGWMTIRGVRRRKGYNRGFVLSDHADWEDILQTVRDVKAKRILTMHGQSEALAKYLSEDLHVKAHVFQQEASIDEESEDLI